MMYSIDIDYGRANEILIFQKLKKFFQDHILCELDYYNDLRFLIFEILRFEQQEIKNLKF